MKKVAGNLKKKKVRTPSGKVSVHLKRSRPSYAKCGNCGSNLNRPKISVGEAKKMPRTELRPERPFPNLCSACMREEIKSLARGA